MRKIWDGVPPTMPEDGSDRGARDGDNYLGFDKDEKETTNVAENGETDDDIGVTDKEDKESGKDGDGNVLEMGKRCTSASSSLSPNISASH